MQREIVKNQENQRIIANNEHYSAVTKTPQEWVVILINDHIRYENSTIPRIEQQFLGVLNLFPASPKLKVLFHLFMKFQIDLKLHMEIEEKTVYPEILANEKLKTTEKISDVDHHEPFLTEISSALQKCEMASNPFVGMLIQQLNNFELELQEHAAIEEKLLNQYFCEIESRII